MEKKPTTIQTPGIDSKVSRRRMITTASAGAISALTGPTLLAQKSKISARSLEIERIKDPKVAAFANEVASLSKVAIAEALTSSGRRSPKGVKRSSGEVVAAYLKERKSEKATTGSIVEELLAKGTLHFERKPMPLKQAYNPKNKAHILDRMGGFIGRNEKLRGLFIDAKGNPPKSEKAKNTHFGGMLTRMEFPWTEPSARTPQPNHSHLNYRLHRINCLQDTNELQKDEISLAGMALAQNYDDPMPINEVAVGQFKTGDDFVWSSPLIFKQFDLTGITFPATFLMHQVMAETDWSGLGEFIGDLYDAVSGEVTLILVATSTAIGTAIAAGTSLGVLAGPIGMIAGAIVGAIVGAILGAIAGASKDDIFTPMEIPMQVPFPTGGSTTSIEAATFRGFGGTYTLNYSWELS